MEIKLFRAAEMPFEPYGSDPGLAQIARLVGGELSDTMGAGVATFDGCSIEWTIRYDELIVVLEGEFRLRIHQENYDMRPGDVIWLPKDTPLFYEGKAARVFYALYPVNWNR